MKGWIFENGKWWQVCEAPSIESCETLLAAAARERFIDRRYTIMSNGEPKARFAAHTLPGSSMKPRRRRL